MYKRQVLAVMYFGARLVVAGELDAASLTSFIVYTAYVAAGLGSLSNLYTELMSGIGASERWV